MYKVIATGSKGNAVLYHDSILVDCGVSYSLIKPFIGKLQLVLLTHEHCDHLNIKTCLQLAFERPTLRFACASVEVFHILVGIKNIDHLDVNKLYDYRTFQISPVKLYHDTANFGFRIFKNGTKIFHATDTAHLCGIEAKDYDLYAIEHNYDEDTIIETVAEIERKGGYAYQRNAINTHLSEQQARDFIFKNGNGNSKVLRLHESKSC